MAVSGVEWNQQRLNESPRPKAGKSLGKWGIGAILIGLNESPRPKAGKFHPGHFCHVRTRHASMKVPARRRGNPFVPHGVGGVGGASMKVPARRRGNGSVDDDAEAWMQPQ